MRYTSPNVGEIIEVRIFLLSEIATFSEQVDNAITLTLNTGVDQDPLPVTPRTAEPDTQMGDTDNGDIWDTPFACEVPKVDATNRNLVHKWIGENLIITYKLKNGEQFCLGTLNMPMRMTSLKSIQPPTPDSATRYLCTFQGSSIDEPYFCTIV